MSTTEPIHPSGFDRRRSDRVPMPPRGGAVSVVGASLLNVSAYGMLIESPVAMEVELELPFRLIVAGEKLDVEARVVACMPAAPGKRRAFGIGLDFTKLPEGARERLAKALKEARAALSAP